MTSKEDNVVYEIKVNSKDTTLYVGFFCGNHQPKIFFEIPNVSAFFI